MEQKPPAPNFFSLVPFRSLLFGKLPALATHSAIFGLAPHITPFLALCPLLRSRPCTGDFILVHYHYGSALLTVLLPALSPAKPASLPPNLLPICPPPRMMNITEYYMQCSFLRSSHVANNWKEIQFMKSIKIPILES